MRVTQMPATGRTNINISTSSIQKKPSLPKSGMNLGEIISGFEKDDYILLGLIAVLVFEGCDDYILLAALGYLFIMGIKE